MADKKKAARFAVIFRATVNEFDEAYSAMAESMRQLAFDEYGCLEFVAVTEENSEVAISYWPDEASIRRWKADPRHSLAQKLGREKWYASYHIQVVEVLREYGSDQHSQS